MEYDEISIEAFIKTCEYANSIESLVKDTVVIDDIELLYYTEE